MIDYASSIIWVRRFQNAGEFELYLPADVELLKLFTENETLITRDDTDTAMLTERVELTTDPEKGDHLIISGCSAEGLLKRRIIRGTKSYQTTAKDAIRSAIVNNLMLPNIGIRRFELLRLETFPDYPETIEMQITGENILNVISTICTLSGFGFQITFDGEYFTFGIYKGIDISQTVIFSPEFENLGSTSCIFDKTDLANSITAMGQFPDDSYKSGNIVTDETSATNSLTLREKYVDATSVESSTEEGDLTREEYGRLINEKAHEELEKSRETKEYSGEILNTDMYKFGEDYWLGDRVSIVNQYGIRGTAVVTEITEVEDAEGYRLIPTFSDWKVS